MDAAQTVGMGREVTDQIPVKPDTKELVKERKADGVTYDHYLRTLMGVEDGVGETGQ